MSIVFRLLELDGVNERSPPNPTSTKMHTGQKSEFVRQLLDPTQPEARAFFYTNLLGFRKSSTRPDTNRGRPKFIGIIGDFHSATQAVVDQIAVKYKSHIDLKETVSEEFVKTSDYSLTTSEI